mmetsp:Transcript_38482/g.46455  ORF Transcript_38482/g.46455 Transcript_38482/m.46455 type:complete len:327 (+) Transcript_38482:89-1069(+)|eukprot:CAMPEP_0197848808 /NCGR_PEP_ID=MMETSP1438-20131217/10124_1 /TAXON_ID=1461541 /ORGANISM="Pterosperma sp., Strain CCMP1384" /LENGTH=326 /DNA_ID=CAMNT_0043461229 /DNA_START=89 /DNA_END=1069 /DNA_ORIENTATION=+
MQSTSLPFAKLAGAVRTKLLLPRTRGGACMVLDTIHTKCHSAVSLGSQRPALQKFCVRTSNALRHSRRHFSVYSNLDPESAFVPGEVEWSANIANSISLIGRLGKDVNFQQISNGALVSETTLAVYRGKDLSPSWFDLQFWDQQAEAANTHLYKGKQVHVYGRIKLETWQDQRTGQERLRARVVVNDFSLIKDDQSVRPQYEYSQPPNQAPTQSNYTPQPRTPSSGGTNKTEYWNQLFDHPNNFWDNRLGKRNPRAPDFKHKEDNTALWLDSYDTPPWVVERLVELGDSQDVGSAPMGGSQDNFNQADDFTYTPKQTSGLPGEPPF